VASSGGISGAAVAVATTGAVLMYAGFRGVSPLQALRDAASGKPPAVVGKSTELPTPITPGATGPEGGSGFSGGVGLLAEVKRLGNGKSYSQLRRTGPDSFDCSGLVWRAGCNIGRWGPGTKWFPQPFNTASFIIHTKEIGLVRRGNAILPVAGDIIWWVGHMGVVESPTRFYSARSSRSTPQIGSLPIAALDKTNGPHQVFYWGKQPSVGSGGGGGGGGSW
jgi:hypothetical protein